MGRMRQGGQTEPERPDDSQKLEERALAEADRDEWVEEGYAAANPRTTASERATGNPTRFHHDDLDNQDPHRRHHAPVTLDEQPEERNSGARVGEPPKPGTELRLEEADVPVKPHGRNDRRSGDDEEA